MEKVGGWLVTIALHVGIVATILVGHAHRAESVAIPRDFMVARIVRLGKQRPKTLLPTIPTQPVPQAPDTAVKLTQNETAKPTPKTEKKPPDAKPGDLKSALAHAHMLQQMQKQEDQEGDPNGSPGGNSTTASGGDIYATAVFNAYFGQWQIPNVVQNKDLTTRVRIFIAPDGNVLKATIIRPSRNGPMDDSVAEVLSRIKKLPPPPKDRALYLERSGIVLDFAPQQ
jgi:TonB family protein